VIFGNGYLQGRRQLGQDWKGTASAVGGKIIAVDGFAHNIILFVLGRMCPTSSTVLAPKRLANPRDKVDSSRRSRTLIFPLSAGQNDSVTEGSSSGRFWRR
jgi:hypothetical protein